MNHFPDNIKFKYPWRNYQHRVLDELKGYLDDNKLHIIAPPGSGKTVLGLEVMLKLNRPTLILSPTITIRNQWADRFLTLFLQTNKRILPWISMSIKNPKFLTVSTYQALHAALKINESKNFINKLPLQKFGTIIVDEAHHLKNEWWKTLTKTVRELGSPTTVALTATPPYDVNYSEWQRYEDFCGPVDAEISVPELVIEKNLCYHQDFIHISSPTDEENFKIQKFRSRINKLYDDVCKDKTIIELLKTDDLINSIEKKYDCDELPYDNEIEAILSNVSYYSSIIIFLNHIGYHPPNGLIKIMGVAKQIIPEFNLEWFEILITGIINKKNNKSDKYYDTIKNLTHRLKSMGVLEKTRVHLFSNDKIRQVLASSQSKLKSIIEIVRLESDVLKEELRLVVLTDFIRLASLPKNENDIFPSKIGVIPIFELIRRKQLIHCKICVLTGSIVIIPSDTLNDFKQYLIEYNIDESEFNCTSLNHTNDYLSLEINGENRQSVVAIITRLFESGFVNLIIGTKSLLGEGWDAPSINSLIMASFVGSHVSSNQMRGRAIRIHLNNPNKTANIWHLVCADEFTNDLGDDFRIMSRRFKAFMGLSFKENIIENGIDRIDIKINPEDREYIDDKNKNMLGEAASRKSMIQKWDKALEKGEEAVRKSYKIGPPKKVEEMRISRSFFPHDITITNTIKAVAYQGFSLMGIVFYQLNRAYNYRSEDNIIGPGEFILLALIFAFIIATPKLYKAVKLLIKNGPIASNIVPICHAVINALFSTQMIKTEFKDVSIYSSSEQGGPIKFCIYGLPRYENSLVLDCIKEILDPVEDPRYILVRSSKLLLKIRRDYHSVPKILSRKKWHAETFEYMWNKFVSSGKVYYTRKTKGRELLLKARGESLAASFIPKAERMSVWR